MLKSALTAVVASIACQGISQLILPYHGIDPSSTLSSFQVMKTGPSGRANTLYITDPANSFDALLVNTVGTGRAGYFILNNPSSTNVSLRGDSNGAGTSILGYMTGTGKAGTFRINNPSSQSPALYVQNNGQAPSLKVEAGYPNSFAAWFEGATYAHGTAYVRAANDYGLDVTARHGGFFSCEQTGIGVFVSNEPPAGGYAYRGVTNTPNTKGVSISSLATSGPSYGVYSEMDSSGGVGIMAYARSATGAPYAIKGNCASPDGYGIYAVGKLVATGAKSFQIDDPLDPENRYLNHFCSEGPEPVNFYEGNVVTDAKGYAIITLPAYFHEVNTNPKYSLTVIDGSDDFVLAKVSKPIANNRFTIRTNKPKVIVSWRVDAIRNDRYMRAYGYQAEQFKEPNNRGKYVQPELWNQPAERGIHYVAPEPMPVAQSQRHRLP